jgi:hypothetical protein
LFARLQQNDPEALQKLGINTLEDLNQIDIDTATQNIKDASI